MRRAVGAMRSSIQASRSPGTALHHPVFFQADAGARTQVGKGLTLDDRQQHQHHKQHSASPRIMPLFPFFRVLPSDIGEFATELAGLAGGRGRAPFCRA